jgi:response regulator NasT
MSEPEAFHWIQRTAMDRRQSMRAVAEMVIAESARNGSSEAGSSEVGS